MSEPFCCLSLNSAWGPWVSFPISGPVAVSALRKLVGVAGFEPATPTSRTWCATSLPLIYRKFLRTSGAVCRVLFTVYLSRSCPGERAMPSAASR